MLLPNNKSDYLVNLFKIIITLFSISKLNEILSGKFIPFKNMLWNFFKASFLLKSLNISKWPPYISVISIY